MLRILLIIILFVIIAGYFFVQWANKPENVAALLQQRAEEKNKPIWIAVSYTHLDVYKRQPKDDS